MRHTKAVINLDNLKKNFLNIRNKVGDRKVMAVVKADAYGHNVKFVTDLLNSLNEKSPEYFAVALIEEAIELRNIGINKPILVFDPVCKDQAVEFIRYNIIATVINLNQIKYLTDAKRKLNYPNKINVHIKIDTGMNRLGIDFIKATEFISEINNNNEINIDGIYTHFATSDAKNSSFTKTQINRFNSVISELKSKKLNYGLVHAANSGAIIDFPEAYYDMVRPGISLYGYYPSHKTSESIKLYPVMSLVSKVSSVKYINKGDTVSYSRKYKAKRTTKIISVPLGYADGFPRALTNKAVGIIKGKFYKQVGTVTMDRIMFDVGNDNINVDDEIILLGSDEKNKIDAWDWSDILKTIPYEITCGISKRVPRTI